MLTEFNQEERVENARHHIKNYRGSTSIKSNQELVVIENWCLMPNHYHLVLRQLVPGGIAKFLQKVMTGYTMYYNLRHERTGALFQGKSKSKHVDEEKYLNWVHYYIDLNPLELLYKDWKKSGVPSAQKGIAYLEAYPWHKRRKYAGETFNRDKFARGAQAAYQPKEKKSKSVETE